jgi:hypothetical protein
MQKLLFLLIIVVMSTSVRAQLGRPTCTTLSGTKISHGIDTTKGRAVANNYSMWDNGQVLTVKFVAKSSPYLRNLVMQYAKEWEQFANIKFKFLPDNAPTSLIRVNIGEGKGHNSAVGTDANLFPKSYETMNLDSMGFLDINWYVAEMERRKIRPNWEDLQKMMATEPIRWDLRELRGTVLHEFGHALGLLHEQSYPNAINWNKDTVYKYYKATQDWDEDQVDNNVLEVANQFFTNGTSYDPKSIMHYSVEAWQTQDGYSLPANNTLSMGDKAIISALYPKGQKVSKLEVPRVTVTNFNKFDIQNNKSKKGISIYPTFDLKTNSKLGRIYVVALLVDEDDNYIRDDNDYYNWGGYVAVYPKLTLLPNSIKGYNKTAKKDLELFLPYDEIPVPSGTKVRFHFRVALEDVQNGQFFWLTDYLTNNYMSITK